MKIVVIGGSGLIGTKLVNRLREKGHEAVAASPNSGVNTITGEGLAEALAGAQVVVDVANSPSFEDKAVLEFFETSGRNLMATERATGVGHHLAEGGDDPGGGSAPSGMGDTDSTGCTEDHSEAIGGEHGDGQPSLRGPDGVGRAGIAG